MNSNALSREPLLQAIESLRTEVSVLSERVAALEQASRPRVPHTQEPPSNGPAIGEPVVDETLISLIAAAVAAYLGVHPRIRQIHLVGGAFWAQQGRVTVQASHALAIRHG
jgi:methylmalonyl-CoA carboxyltransferase large subunit